MDFFGLLQRQFIIAVLFAVIYYITYDNYTFKNSHPIKNKQEKFINSIYYSVVTQFTVGYGSIYPQTNIGKIICMIHIFISFYVSTVFSYTAQIVKTISKEDEKNNIIYDFLTNNPLVKTLTPEYKKEPAANPAPEYFPPRTISRNRY